ncbi:MAG: branched-chain amino acid ABC transporter permease [Burkholderiales bacterium]|nr:branched-chain amino acid ABC transporter permease [Burkholderiales bacterium]
MSSDIVLWLVQDGVISGAIYALLALALLLVFAVTRIIFVSQGDFVSFAALTLGTLQLGQVPGTVYLLAAGGIAVTLMEMNAAWRQRALRRRLPRILLAWLALPLLAAGLVAWAAPRQFGPWVLIAMTLLVIVPLGPMLYRVAFRPVANASVLVLFIVSIAAHYALTGIGLAMFGGEGLRTDPIADLSFDLGNVKVSAQSLWVLGTSVAGMVALWLFFERSLYGKALRATAINRVGARLVGIPTELSGQLAFWLAAAMGALSGLLISPITTMYFDSGLMIGLKGFVAAILGGMASYPLAVVGALGVGLLEAFSSFWASAYKEVIVFTLLIPVLLWLSLTSKHVVSEDEEE